MHIQTNIKGILSPPQPLLQIKSSIHTFLHLFFFFFLVYVEKIFVLVHREHPHLFLTKCRICSLFLPLCHKSSSGHHHLLPRLLSQTLNWFLCFQFPCLSNPVSNSNDLSEMKISRHTLYKILEWFLTALWVKTKHFYQSNITLCALATLAFYSLNIFCCGTICTSVFCLQYFLYPLHHPPLLLPGILLLIHA